MPGGFTKSVAGCPSESNLCKYEVCVRCYVFLFNFCILGFCVKEFVTEAFTQYKNIFQFNIFTSRNAAIVCFCGEENTAGRPHAPRVYTPGVCINVVTTLMAGLGMSSPRPMVRAITQCSVRI